ncbi:matrixin family metalloprotease [Myxococcaceae bacterium JPH2]|nr:matrixin family metalloprotease [Myxococcaceae bacterium JPH2]
MKRSRLLLLIACAVAGVAGAQQGLSFRRTAVRGRPLCLMWPGRDYVYHLDAAGTSRTPRDAAVTAIEAAFDSWRALSASCSDYRFIRGDDWTLPVSAGYDKEHPADSYNVILFRDRACQDVVAMDDPCWDAETCGNLYSCWQHGPATIGLTTSTFSFTDGRVLDADIELNSSQPGGGTGFLFTTVNAPVCSGPAQPTCVATDLQNTLTHEIGHVVGLDHVDDRGSTMEATAPQGETAKRVIDSGSARGFCSTYPRGLPPTQCEPPKDAGMKLVVDGRGTGCASTGPGSALVGLVLGAGVLLRRRGRRAGG